MNGPPIKLTRQQRAEFRALCSNPATTPEQVVEWCRARGQRCDLEHARLELQVAQGRARRSPEAEGVSSLDKELEQWRARAVAIVGEGDPRPLQLLALQSAEMHLARELAKACPDVVRVRHLADVIQTLEGIRANRPTSPVVDPSRRQIIIPPGTVEYITKQLYGVRLS